jgi:ribosomal protein S18 acetylase RimI-like enzyme
MTAVLVATRAATPADLPAVVRVHQAAFPGFFLTRLGPGFLRAYYRLVLDYPGGVLAVAAEDGVVTGFVAGFLDPPGFYRCLRAGAWRFVLPLLGRVLTRPALAPEILRGLRRSGGHALPAPCPGTPAELSSVGVDPAREGRGAGQALVGYFIAEMTARGAGWIGLSTDADDNARVNRFYQRLGFHLAETYVQPPDRSMHAYTLSLVEREPIHVP